MKVKFSNEVTFIPTWKGNDTATEANQFRVIVKPLEMNDLIDLLDVLGSVDKDKLASVGDEPSEENAKEALDQSKEMLKQCGHLVPKYCKVENLEGENGPVSIQDVVTYPFFMQLSIEILMQMAVISMPTETDEKNSDQQPAS